MAHTCPECGSACYCNGDIDDCLLEDDHAVNACTCCPIDGVDDPDEFDDDDMHSVSDSDLDEESK